MKKRIVLLIILILTIILVINVIIQYNIDMTLNFDYYPLESLTVPILVIHAKDDPMAKYKDIEKLLERVNAETAIYETGGHMIVGQDCSVQIEKFLAN